jgi:protein ImuB
MSKAQVETCPGIVLRSRSLLQEKVAHAALLDCAQSFSPRVEDTGCDTLLLDLAGLESLFGEPSKIAHEIARRALQLGLEINVAVAGNADTAILAARGFSGVTVIPETKESEQLGTLPVEVLFSGVSDTLASEILETLNRWGVRRLQDLAALPELALSERLGQQGLYLQQLARGATFRTLVPLEPPLVFEEAVELEHPVILLEPLAFLLSRMLEQLCARLAGRALATQELKLELELQQGFSCEHSDLLSGGSATQNCNGSGTSKRDGKVLFKRTLHLPVPLLDAQVFLKLLQLDLRAHPPGAPIVKIFLSAEPAQPRPSQNGFFRPPSPEPEKLEITLARIAAIVGETKAGSVELLDTHHPEGFHMQRFAPHQDSRKHSTFGEKIPALFFEGRGALETEVSFQTRRSDPVTAMRIFRPPVRARVTIRDGKPARVTCRKRKQIEGEILWLAGPWRSSGDWWEQTQWARDEWDIALQESNGIALYRLVHDLLGGGWFVEGSYD